MKQRIRIDVVSDVVCPWCYIGKRRLEKALQNLAGKYDFDVTYHPFELNPQLPVEGVNQKEYLVNKFGGEERYHQITAHVTRVAAEEGLTFNFQQQAVSPNTRHAHRIIQWALPFGKQADVKEALMKAYFTEGIDLSKPENLASVSSSAGLNKNDVEALLQTSNGLAAVERAGKEMQQLGITGVPFYIIQNKYGLSGAQPTAIFMETIEEAAKQTTE
ncbi:MAG: DsbA family oxidoreductase [Cyclobacteriaceae bacterium]|nr:DsbA family oxidoreductase [Cyclobacteriaceae bacterium]UYN87895.1 MAG: DsbA family oxidoreductase [Cyclobacteriaceae bacterium]